MACSIEYRKYMDECLRAAAKAASEDERKSLLQLAQTWHEAASNLEASAGLMEESLTVSAQDSHQAQEP
ncbi:MAG: hypothetical protein QOD29_3236 [Alphaproteobacteria bacterium]|jgi:hypothetical protein|nr:hypothetical protein [Alphaproteobacteria bacterium]